MTLEAVNGTSVYSTPEVRVEPVRTTEAVTTEMPEQTGARKAEIVDIKDAAAKTEFGVKDDSEKASASNAQIKEAVEKINKHANTEAVFGIHDATNRVTIKIVDKDSKEVIKELPPEQTLDMIAKAWELAGLFVDEKR